MLDMEPIKAKLAAATPGPWTVHPMYPRCITTKAAPGVSLLALDVDEYAIVEDEHDAELIASAPTDLAALVAEVERLRLCEFDEYALRERLEAVKNAANWSGRGPIYTAVEQDRIDTLVAVAKDQGWLMTHDDETGRWVSTPQAAS